MQQWPIGVFDSGVGGLTVLRAIREELPNESVVYLGDTARVPYGTKSHRSVRRYALQAVAHLIERRIKLLVVACNTVSAVALDDLRKKFDRLPILGVVEPAAEAAVRQSRSRQHLVLGTEGTVERGAYAEAIRNRDPGACVQEISCSLFVSLVEEGWTGGPIVDAIAGEYLGPALRASCDKRPDSVILGCTHFGLLEAAIRRQLGDGFSLVDSARTVAGAVRSELERRALRTSWGPGRVTLLATDHPDRFTRVGRAFLGEGFSRAEVEWIDL